MRSALRGEGVELQIFGREAPENGAEGAVLENFSDFSEKLFLRNAIKLKISIYGVKFFLFSFRKNCFLKLQ